MYTNKANIRNSAYHFISEKEESFEKRIVDRLQSCKFAILASAFFTKGALDALENALIAALENGAKITFLLGRWDYITEPRAVKKLIRIAEKYPKQLETLFDEYFGFHYKLAIFQNSNNHIVIIGSSNLTPKGLATEGEANLEVVRNASVYRQAKDCLNKRIEYADRALDVIKEYELVYKRAQRFRKQRRRWQSCGGRNWARKKRTVPLSIESVGNRFTLCLINDHEDDKALKASVSRERQHARRINKPIQGTWVHEVKSCDRLYREGKDFIVVDDVGKCFGFATCTKKIRVLDSNESREPIIFYKFRYGWKFSDHAKYEKYRSKLFPIVKPIAGKVVSQRLKTFFITKKKSKSESGI